MITVIHKKGDPTTPENYRPICSLPKLYKLFFTTIYNRLYAKLDSDLFLDQAGLRENPDDGSSYDVQTCCPENREWRTDMWVAAIDFQKPFDSIRHNAIWRSLRNHSISEHYICRLKKLYADQRATVWTDVESDEFEMARGTKQGDSLSSILFNSRLQSAMEKDIGTWNEKGLGIELESEKRYCTSNFRFPDDVLVMTNSPKHLKRMMTDFKKEVQKRKGLTFIQTRRKFSPIRKQTG